MSVSAFFTDALEVAREPGASYFSVPQVMKIFDLQQQELANLTGIHRNTLYKNPQSPRLQARIRDLVRVLSAVTAIQSDQQRAVFLMKNEPIPAFEHKTLLQLVEHGRAEDAINYLSSIEAGFVG